MLTWGAYRRLLGTCHFEGSLAILLASLLRWSHSTKGSLGGQYSRLTICRLRDDDGLLVLKVMSWLKVKESWGIGQIPYGKPSDSRKTSVVMYYFCAIQLRAAFEAVMILAFKSRCISSCSALSCPVA